MRKLLLALVIASFGATAATVPELIRLYDQRDKMNETMTHLICGNYKNKDVCLRTAKALIDTIRHNERQIVKQELR